MIKNVTTTVKKNWIINATNISKNYSHFAALKPTNFEVMEGERLGIVGVNGSGKSTLVEILSGIKAPSSGKVEYSFGTTKSEISKHIGVQFQESQYPVGVTVMDMINFYIEVYGIQITKEQLDEKLRMFGLIDHKKKNIKSLSGGLQQRLNVLLALIHSPKVLVLDEVSTGLDIAGKTDIMFFIKKLVDELKITLLLVTHNMQEIEYLCTDLVLLSAGNIIEKLSVKDVIKKYKSVDIWITSWFEKHKDLIDVSKENKNGGK